jgi:hypothetical protein
MRDFLAHKPQFWRLNVRKSIPDGGSSLIEDKNNSLQTGILHTTIVKKRGYLQKRVEGGSNASHCATIPADGY